MDDLMGKIQEVLSDPESMQQLSELAAMFRSSGGEASEDAQAQPEPPQDAPSAAAPENPFGDFDFSKLMQLQGLFGSLQNDKNAELLLALRPHVCEERQVKIDRAVKLLKLYAMWTMLRESGMLKDLI